MTLQVVQVYASICNYRHQSFLWTQPALRRTIFCCDSSSLANRLLHDRPRPVTTLKYDIRNPFLCFVRRVSGARVNAMPVVNVAPRPEGPMSSNGFELLPGEKEIHAVDVKFLTGEDVRLLITDRRLVTRASQGICTWPLNLCFVCFRADVDDSYAIGDIKYVQPWTFKGAIASCLGCMYAAKKIPCCGWLPGMMSGGMRVNLARPKGDFVPGWGWFPSWAATGYSTVSLAFQMRREEAEALRRALVLHPEATGLGFNVKTQVKDI